MGIDLSGQRDRQRHSRSSVAPLAHPQHQGGKLPAEGEAEGRRVDSANSRPGHFRRWRMMPAQVPAARLRLKRSFGWFAAGLEVSTALPMLYDAAFKLYIFLCLNVDRHSARMVWEPMELANLLYRDCQSVTARDDTAQDHAANIDSSHQGLVKGTTTMSAASGVAGEANSINSLIISR